MANKPKFTITDILLAIRGNPNGSKRPRGQDEDAIWYELWVDDNRVSSYGHIATIAKRLNCTEQTVRNYMTRCYKSGKMAGELKSESIKIQEAIQEEKNRGLEMRNDFEHVLVSDAEKALHTNVKFLNQQAIQFTLERLDKKRYTKRTEMTGADGQPLFDSETLRLMEELGVDPNEALRQTALVIKQKLIAANEASNKSSSMERGDE